MNNKSFLIIAIATLITVVFWVGADIMHARSNVKISSKLESVIEPLNPNFDQSAIKLLSQ